MDIFMQILGYLGAIGIAVFSMPSLIGLCRTRNTMHINPWLFGLLTFSSICFFVSGFYNFGIAINKPGATFTSELAFSLAVAIANVFSGGIALIVLIFKWINVHNAKKNNLSEEEYCKKIMDEIKRKKEKL